ncbi:MAG: hypothetical protein IT438_09095 [Phycisphaerales bacterium]|nr:hypothetical protein [Phycisphaerales bacterium]
MAALRADSSLRARTAGEGGLESESSQPSVASSTRESEVRASTTPVSARARARSRDQARMSSIWRATSGCRDQAMNWRRGTCAA